MPEQPKPIQIKLGDSVANRVNQVLTAIGHPEAAASDSAPTAINALSAISLVATGSGCQKLFSIVEIVKRRLSSEKLVYHQYNRLTGQQVEIETPPTEGTEDKATPATEHPALISRRFKTMPKLEIWLSLQPLPDMSQNPTWTYQSSAK
ncbi:hypothetical protein NADFUDRAFT_52968 [Nadsonia fulvescens var. elongata DSM 6958]|uniref:DNA/RNA-binding protein Alba-like domain-containing protein n=1 Tax=Nadsonia fulvescens var. elongata DSM 6958 TaxID=857566 RepID=A0A1E3PEZ4_9ASCO|nr:hypothetical protein NADFUDRAFT_52968 [Nadsonia fulvescens var. elongata DSM 6958]